jgi:hypothetical protein
MSEPTPSRPAADRNLLFGILALQMDFISRDALIKAMHAWVLEKAKPLGQILIEQGALRADAHAVLEPLVHKHLELHGNDPEKSLASVSSLGSATAGWHALSLRRACLPVSAAAHALRRLRACHPRLNPALLTQGMHHSS